MCFPDSFRNTDKGEQMRSLSTTSSRGFTLVEMLIALTLGLVVIAAAVQLFSKGVSATWMVSQRAELQQNARGSSNMLTKDISLAGAGLPTGGVALASGTGSKPRYGCDYTGRCYLGPTNSGAMTYPAQTAINYMYGVIPGWKQGVTVNAAAGATDVITVVYADTSFLLGDYTVKFNDLNGNSVTFTLPTPPPNPLDQAVNNTGVGLQQGDLVLFSSTAGSAYAVAEVTAPLGAGAGPSYNVAFGNLDSLLFNQNAATSNDLKQIATTAGTAGPAVGVTATRIWAITYYLDNATNPGTPTLMRLVNARVPVPLAENVADLRFTYDTYDSSGNLLNATGDGGMGLIPSISPSQIRTINLAHLTIRSQLPGQSGYQSMDIQNSVSARNMSFSNRYK
jgi:prepilin-type N-terminal cleavage/methylation domain-containing protein